MLGLGITFQGATGPMASAQERIATEAASLMLTLGDSDPHAFETIVPSDSNQAEPKSSAKRVGEMIRQRFPSGKTQIERWVIESSKGDLVNHGAYVEFNENGDVVTSGSFAMGVRDGAWSKQLDVEQAKQLAGFDLSDFTPPFVSKANFDRGQLQGDWTCADSRGNLLFVWAFQQGKRNGPSTSFNPRGEMTRSITYVNNFVHGPAKVALKSDEPPQDIQFDEGRMLRRVDQFFPGGNRGKVLKSQDWYLVPTPFNLASHDWAANQVQALAYDANDMLRHGRAITFYSNGQRESEGNYEKGKKVGTFVWWYANGQEKTVGEYDNDVEQGVWRWWHENGMREATGSFVNGKKVDQWSIWNAEGKLVRRVDAESSMRTVSRSASAGANY